MYPIKQIIKLLQKDYVINLADKLPNNYSICCKNWWWHTLKATTFQNILAYKQIYTKTPTQIIQRHIKYLTKHHIPTHNKLPIKRISSKYHKDKPGTRPLLAAPATTTTYLDKALTLILDASIKSLKQEANLFEAKNGYSWFLDIENTEQVTTHIHKLNNKTQPQSIITADADGFYDSIRHYWLSDIYRTEIPKIFKANHATFIVTNIKYKTFKWTNKPVNQTNNIHCFTANTVVKLLLWSLQNQYQLIGPHLVKQTIGVAQGSPHSGHQSRFMCIISERNFIINLTNTNKTKTAKKFANTIRKHDDIAFFNVKKKSISKYFHIHANQPGLYPWFIKPSWTNEDPFTTANYLNVTITQHDNTQINYTHDLKQLSAQDLRLKLRRYHLRQTGNKDTLILRLLNSTYSIPHYPNNNQIWITKPYSKTQNFPNALQAIANNFPQYDTNIPTHIKTGVIVGHLHTLFNTTSRIAKHFTDATSTFFYKLITKNKYPKHLLIKQLRRFLKTKKKPFENSPHTIIYTISNNIAKATNPDGWT
jgi:hypothetical protein